MVFEPLKPTDSIPPEAIVNLTPANFQETLPAIYDHLKELATRSIRKQPAGFTLCATDLLHEAILRLCAHSDQTRLNPQQLYFTIALATRRALIDHARKRTTRMRDVRLRCSIGECEPEAPLREQDLLVLDELLSELQLASPRKAQVIELRYFGGLSVAQIAELLDISIPTAERDCRTGLAFLSAGLKHE